MTTAITVQEAPSNGQPLENLTFTTGDVTGMEFVNDGKTLIIANNTNVGAQLVTISGQPGADSGRSTPDVTLSVPAGAYAMAGPFKTSNFNTATGSAELATASADVEFVAISYKEASS